MPKTKILNPWTSLCCDKKFPKNEGYEKLQKLDFSNPNTRRLIRNTRNNESDFYKKHKLWFDHLLCVEGNVLLDGRCPKSTCVFCLTYESELFNFSNRSTYSYHNKKNCPYKGENLKSFANNYIYHNKEQNLLLDKEIEQEEDYKKKELASERLEKKKKEEEEEKLRKEEEFKSRAAFYDPPPPRSQESIDREKRYKKCPKEKAIEISMAEN